MGALCAVWRAGHERPLFVGRAFFKQGITDLAWTSDGYALLVCSSDGGFSLGSRAAAGLTGIMRRLPAPHQDEVAMQLILVCHDAVLDLIVAKLKLGTAFWPDGLPPPPSRC